MLLTAVASREAAVIEVPFAEALSGPEHAPAILDRWRPWLVLAVVLIAIAYGPTIIRLVTTTPFTTPGFRVW
jgi:cytochrome c oxidase subunit 1